MIINIITDIPVLVISELAIDLDISWVKYFIIRNLYYSQIYDIIEI